MSVVMLFAASSPTVLLEIKNIVVSASAVAAPGVSKLSVSSVTSGSVTLKWSKASSAAGYTVYSYDQSSKKYTALANTAQTTYTVKNLKEGSTYRYAVRAFSKSADGKKVYGKYSTVVKAATSVGKPSKVKGLTVGSKTATSVTLKWSKVSNAQKYVVYKYIKSEKKYSKLATTSSLTYKVSGLSSGTAYMFAVRACKTVNSKEYFGDYSDIVTVKMASSSSSGGSSSGSVSLNRSSRVYITPTGKKYHLSSSCAGKNAQPTTYGKVKGKYDPCKKCAS